MIAEMEDPFKNERHFSVTDLKAIMHNKQYTKNSVLLSKTHSVLITFVYHYIWQYVSTKI